MKDITMKVYHFNELDEDVQERIISSFDEDVDVDNIFDIYGDDWRRMGITPSFWWGIGFTQGDYIHLKEDVDIEKDALFKYLEGLYSLRYKDVLHPILLSDVDIYIRNGEILLEYSPYKTDDIPRISDYLGEYVYKLQHILDNLVYNIYNDMKSNIQDAILEHHSRENIETIYEDRNTYFFKDGSIYEMYGEE